MKYLPWESGHSCPLAKSKARQAGRNACSPGPFRRRLRPRGTVTSRFIGAFGQRTGTSRSTWAFLWLLALGSQLPAEPHPAFETTNLSVAKSLQHSRDVNWKPGAGLALEVSGLAWIGGPSDRLALCIRKGDVIFADHVLGAPSGVKFSVHATGLHEPLGLLVDGKDLLVCQRAEVTRLRDRDGNGVADEYLTECDGWNVSGNYHAYAYGPESDGKSRRWVTLNLGMGDFAANAKGWRGWGGTISEDGRFQPMAAGMRSPCGMGANLVGDVFFTDQQGTWIPATPVHHLRPGVFYGNQESKGSFAHPDAPFRLSKLPKNRTKYPEAVASVPEFVPPAVWLPYNKMGRSGTDIEVVPKESKFAPEFAGQLLVGEFTNCQINRVFLEKVGGEYQGACFPFLDGFAAAVIRLEFAPDGSLLVGMSNRGWTSLGNRSYGLARVRRTEAPFAVQEMRARPDGFDLQFTAPVDAGSLAALSMSSYTYLYSSTYGGDEIDTRRLKLGPPRVSGDGRTVTVPAEGLRAGHVHELHLDGVASKNGTRLDRDRAYYTLNRIPR